jgi:hypothetical protein
MDGPRSRAYGVDHQLHGEFLHFAFDGLTWDKNVATLYSRARSCTISVRVVRWYFPCQVDGSYAPFLRTSRDPYVPAFLTSSLAIDYDLKYFSAQNSQSYTSDSSLASSEVRSVLCTQAVATLVSSNECVVRIDLNSCLQILMFPQRPTSIC